MEPWFQKHALILSSGTERMHYLFCRDEYSHFMSLVENDVKDRFCFILLFCSPHILFPLQFLIHSCRYSSSSHSPSCSVTLCAPPLSLLNVIFDAPATCFFAARFLIIRNTSMCNTIFFIAANAPHFLPWGAPEYVLKTDWAPEPLKWVTPAFFRQALTFKYIWKHDGIIIPILFYLFYALEDIPRVCWVGTYALTRGGAGVENHQITFWLLVLWYQSVDVLQGPVLCMISSTFLNFNFVALFFKLSPWLYVLPTWLQNINPLHRFIRTLF